MTRRPFDADAAFRCCRYTSLKVGYSHLGTDYTHRIWETTAEDVFRISVDTTGNQFVMLRAVYENRERTGDNFEPDALAEVGELAGMRHFDVADRNRQRFTLHRQRHPRRALRPQRLGRGRPRRVYGQRARPAVLRLQPVLDRRHSRQTIATT